MKRKTSGVGDTPPFFFPLFCVFVFVFSPISERVDSLKAKKGTSVSSRLVETLLLAERTRQRKASKFLSSMPIIVKADGTVETACR